MKNKHKIFPFVFLLFGITLISVISGYSIKKYINDKKTSETLVDKETNKKQDLELFFNKPKTAPAKTLIKIYKSKRILELYGDEKLMGRFKIALGRAPEEGKEKQGDNRTPEGDYYICNRTDQTKYTYFMGLSYPNIEDAKKALDKGTIDEKIYNSIKKAINEKKQPPWNTPLGGAVGIHGGGTKYDNWTYGCIALSNEDINIIKDYAPLRTPVEIYK